MKEIIVGLTGASGAIVFKETIVQLSKKDIKIYVIATDNGKKVFNYELDEELEEFLLKFENVYLEENDNMFSYLASGSNNIDAMVITPCSMSSIGSIANGITNSLLIRAADVMIKEKKPLVLSIRETPLSSIHLDNLSKLANNTYIYPLVPAFYHHPKTIDDLVRDLVTRQNFYLGFKKEKIWTKGNL